MARCSHVPRRGTPRVMGDMPPGADQIWSPLVGEGEHRRQDNMTPLFAYSAQRLLLGYSEGVA